MNITVEDAGTCLKKVSVEIPVSTIKSKLNESYRQLAKQVTLPGFRPGKAPRSVLEKRYGDHVRDDVRSKLIELAVREAVQEHDLDMLGQPELESEPKLDPSAPMNIALTMEVRPAFELPEYKGLEIEAPAVTVQEHEVDIYLRNLLLTRAEMNEIPDGDTSKKDDLLFADFGVYVDGAYVSGRNGGNIEVGSKTILGIEIPEALEAFSGLPGDAAGVEKSFNVTLPDDFPIQKYAGREAEIRVTVHAIRRPDAPELTDDFAKELDFDTIGELREHLQDMISEEKERQQQHDVESRLLDGIIEQVDLEIPPKLAERNLSTVLQRESFRMYQEGMDETAIREYIEKRREELPQTIEHDIRMTLVVDAIAKKERLFVTENEISRYIVQLAASRNQDPSELAAQLDKMGMIGQIRWDMKASKVRTFLRQKANVSIRGGDKADAGADAPADEAAETGDES